MTRLLAWMVVGAVVAGCGVRQTWSSSEPDGRGTVTAPICALQARGDLSERAQLETIEGRLPELLGCLEQSAGAEPVVVVAISREGEVQAVQGPGGARLDGAAGCVAGVIRSLRFPSPSCGMAAEVALRFRADAPPQVLAGGTCHGTEGLSKDAIAQVIADHEREARHCFESRRALDPALRGTVAVQFVIDRGGKIAWIGLPQELPDPEVGRCIVGAMRAWRFPQPCGGIVSGSHAWVFEGR